MSAPMSTTDLRLAAVATLATTLLSLSPAQSQQPPVRREGGGRAGPPDRLELGIAHLDGEPAEGFTCFSMAIPCPLPSLLEITREGETELRWVPRMVDGNLVSEPPHVACLPTDDLDERPHSYLLRATCPSRPWTASRTVRTRQRSFGVESVTPDRGWYGFGATVVLEVDGLDEGLDIEADFSAVDSSYQPGDEQTTEVGSGIYRVAYALSAANTRPSGDHSVVVSLTRPASPTGRARTDSASATLRYLPNGPRLAHIAGGASYPDPLPPPDTTVSPTVFIDGGRALGDPTVGDGTPPPDPAVVFGDPGPSPEHLGQRVQLFLSSTGAAPRQLLNLEVAEPARDGYTRVPLDTSSAVCDPAVGVCAYTADIWVRPKGPDVGTVLLDLRLTDGSTTSVDFQLDLDLQAPELPPPEPNYRVKGTIRYQHRVSQPDFGSPLATSPQDYPEKFVTVESPAARANLHLWDSCGHGWSIYTDDEGGFSHDFFTQCGDQPAQIRVFSYREPSPQAVVVFKWTNPNLTVDEPTDLTANPNDYGVHGYDIATFTPDDGPIGQGGQDLGTMTIYSGLVIAKALTIMDATARAVDYFKSWKNGWLFHQMNVEYDPTRVMIDDWNIYLPSTHPSLIHIHGDCVNGCTTTAFGWRSFAHAHEVGHYFHRQFLRDDGGSYGRFGEPMANFNAASILDLEYMYRFSGTNNWVLESMDLNGFSSSDAFFKQAQMDFFPDTQAAALACAEVQKGNGTCCDEATQTLRGDCRLAHSQGWDWRAYWDLHDPTSGQAPEPVETVYVNGNPNQPVTVAGFDGIDGRGGNPSPSDDEVMDVLVNYLGDNPANPAYDDRGMSGIDLVDVLDGMVCRGHMSQGAGTKLLNQMMAYGYDFDPPQESCP